MVVAVLAAGGFSLRWSYYYNFGLHTLVLQAPLNTLPVYAVEIVRDSENFLTLLNLTLRYVAPLQAILILVRCARTCRWRRVGRLVRFIERFAGLDSPIVVEALRAGAFICVAFAAGSEAGTRNYWHNAVEATSGLPRVTLVQLSDKSETGLPVQCDQRPLAQRSSPAVFFIGDQNALRALNGGRACSAGPKDGSWRLLHRDEKYVYIFYTVQQRSDRPYTLALAQNDKFILILR
ncbi:hypothetical protein TSO221_03535 [Azospirillum sp. TSO22-1]|nr:hypothetical protein TSO221_03535 [Azospirillum sp. TSO22-1]